MKKKKMNNASSRGSHCDGYDSYIIYELVLYYY